MRKNALIWAVVLTSVMVLCGCGTSGMKAGNIPDQMREAVMRSFADVFDGSWGGVTVYIERSQYLPPILAEVGKNPARIVDSVYSLQKQAEDEMEQAPALAIVKAWEDEEKLIHVVIIYEPLKVEGLEPQTRGGGFDYTYKRLPDGKLVLKQRTKSLN